MATMQPAITNLDARVLVCGLCQTSFHQSCRSTFSLPSPTLLHEFLAVAYPKPAVIQSSSSGEKAKENYIIYNIFYVI